MRRVAVTGLGVISSLGTGSEAFWNALSAGRSGFYPIQNVDTSSFRFQVGAQVQNYQPAEFFEARQYELLDRFAQFGLIAARQAMQQSGITLSDEQRESASVFTGSSIGGQESQDREFWAVYGERKTRVHPMTIVRTMPNGGASAISQEFGLRGQVVNVSTACASSNHAIGHALQAIRSGDTDFAIAGGCESIFSYGILKAWEAMRVVSPDTCRPFSKDRKGLMLGEGGAMLVLEEWESAQRRGAKILAELAGFGMSSDAGHITQPDATGAALAMQRALRSGRMEPNEVGYINAHGTGTTANDATETKAVHLVFGEHARHLAMSSTKSMHGHGLGVAGAMEAVATVLALQHDLLPPTMNYNEPDPVCDLDVIPNAARELRVNAALSNSFAFGGLNAVIAFRRA